MQAFNWMDFIASKTGGEDGKTGKFWNYRPSGLQDPREGVNNVDMTHYPSSGCHGCPSRTISGEGLLSAHNGVDPKLWRA